MKSLLNQINSITRIKPEVQEALFASFKKEEIRKGAFLLREGSVCKNLSFLEQGCLRGFYYLEEKEITHWFAFENNFVTSFQSFITQRSSVENLQALEDCILWSISYDSLNRLYDMYPEIERLGRMVCEQYYLRLEERYVNAQFKTASERYNDLLTSNSKILQRVPLGCVASYLGISQETLSRIRNKK
ncbi:MAG TPA: Crp/Fnr family transcriptional regulator [Cytophagaceae bacterium]